ncbi:MAG: hypothetical protein KAG95_02925, partial [Bacteroidales bacterium]|nr:hypothetical protein [Bacteroidales bacterium]
MNKFLQIIFTLFLSVFFTTTSYAQHTFTNYTNKNNVQALAVDADTIWLGTDGGVVKRSKDGTLLAKYINSDGLCNNNVVSIAIDKQGNKWFGTDNGGGVSKFDGTNWTTYLNGNSVYAIA